MPNIASILKEEITRLARKELRANTDSLKRQVTGYRSEIAKLKRRIDVLERQTKRLGKAAPAKPEEGESDEGAYRWRPDGFAKHRRRLELSASDMGKLLGVSMITVYKWEKGETRPRPRHLPAISELRKLGKREATKRLEELQG